MQGLPINQFSRAKIDASVAELKKEKIAERIDLVGLLLPARSLSLPTPDDSKKRVWSSAVTLLMSQNF